jgi:hypothetical protein
MTGEGRGEADITASEHQSIRASERQSVTAVTASQRHHSPRDFFIVLYNFFFLLIN